MWSLLLQMSQNLMKTDTKHNMFAVIINTEITKKQSLIIYDTLKTQKLDLGSHNGS